ncbi:hypothetical protein QOZ75_29500, partial [Pseudomonas aeruginosa]|uniref:hypothetical protein n=1 Tax=Pseudomonas aeruginosa TaxID=287 RepID=UPI00345AE868
NQGVLGSGPLDVSPDNRVVVVGELEGPSASLSGQPTVQVVNGLTARPATPAGEGVTSWSFGLTGGFVVLTGRKVPSDEDAPNNALLGVF